MEGILGLGHNKPVIEPEILPELCNKNIIEFKNGSKHCIARSVDRKLYSFGDNNQNQLGYKSIQVNNNRPKLIKGLNNERIAQISCGEYHTIALSEKGELFGWGNNIFGQIGINSGEANITIPMKIQGFNGEKIESISCSKRHSMALTVKSNVYSWGDNYYGQLGINTTGDSRSPKMIVIKDILFSQISCGRHHSLLLSTNGDIYSFGCNDSKQLGYETELNYKQMIPRLIETKPDIDFSNIFSNFNEDFSTAVSSTDFCYIWGNCQIFTDKQYFLPFKINLRKKLIFEFEGITDENMIIINLHSISISNEYFKNNFIRHVERTFRGSFGEVIECTNRITKESSAVKSIKIEKTNIRDKFREQQVLCQLKNELIVGYKQSWIEKIANNEIFLYIEMELCLKNLKQLNEQLLNELECYDSLTENYFGFYIMTELMKEVIEGVNYLHKNNVIHRDLKPENILISDYKTNGKYVRIGDFGVSCIISLEGQSLSGDVGTIAYMAPELQYSSNRDSGRIVYTNKVDIYSLGKILNSIFDLENHDHQFDSSIVTELSTISIDDDKFGNIVKTKINGLQTIFVRMISTNPDFRPSCEEILEKCNDWSIRSDEVEQNPGLNDILCHQSEDNESMDENFHKYFLRNKISQALPPIQN